MPKMLDGLPPLMRPRMLAVGRFGSNTVPFRSTDPALRKFAMLLVGTLKLPKLWNRFSPPPGLVPPVMSYWIFPGGGVADRVTCVLSPEGVMGEAAWTREVGYGTASTTEQLRRRQESTLPCSAARCFIGAPPMASWFTHHRDSRRRRTVRPRLR